MINENKIFFEQNETNKIKLINNCHFTTINKFIQLIEFIVIYHF